MDAEAWQTASKGKESSAKYLVRSPTVLIWAYADVVCTCVLLYYLFSSSHVCAGVVLSSPWADICPLCLINLLNYQEQFLSMFRMSLLLNTWYILIRDLYLVLVLMCLFLLFLLNAIANQQSLQHVYFSLVANTVSADLPLVSLLSLTDLICHRHTCKLRPAGLLLILGPPCESTLSLSLPIILEHYWLLICLSALPQISNVITKSTNNPLCSYLVIAASNTPFI